MNKKIHYSEKY